MQQQAQNIAQQVYDGIMAALAEAAKAGAAQEGLGGAYGTR
jgi:hypothetical protein